VDIEIDGDTVPPPARAKAARISVDEEDSQVVDFTSDNPGWDPNADTLRPPKAAAKRSTPRLGTPAAEPATTMPPQVAGAPASSRSKLTAAQPTPVPASTDPVPGLRPAWLQRLAKTPRVLMAGGTLLGISLALLAALTQRAPSAEAASPTDARKVAGDLLASAARSTDAVPTPSQAKPAAAPVASAPAVKPSAPALTPQPSTARPAPAPGAQPSTLALANENARDEQSGSKPADPRQHERDLKTDQARVLVRQGTAYRNLG